MTQDKAPEWAYDVVDNMRVSREAIALALSQAYERGQVDMRERAAEDVNGVDSNILEGMSESAVSVYCRARVDAAKSIRSLPIDSAAPAGSEK